MNDNQKGMSLIEVLVSLLLVVIVLFALLGFTNAAFRTSRRNMDKQFATQKAISMLEELKTRSSRSRPTARRCSTRTTTGPTVNPDPHDRPLGHRPREPP